MISGSYKLKFFKEIKQEGAHNMADIPKNRKI